MDSKNMQKMVFIHNAIENGWTVKKQNPFYLFKKKHNGRREVFKDSYTDTFIKENHTNSSISNILNISNISKNGN